MHYIHVGVCVGCYDIRPSTVSWVGWGDFLQAAPLIPVLKAKPDLASPAKRGYASWLLA